MSKFASKFRRSDDYDEEPGYIMKESRSKKQKNEQRELKKKLKRWEYENTSDEYGDDQYLSS